MRNGSALRLTFVAGVLVLGLVGLVPPAVAMHLSCGQTVSGNVVLDEDLTCTGHGLVVGADKTTIDLNGHTITGDGGAETTDEDVGILVDGKKKVNITSSRPGGAIQQFWFGIRLINANKNKVLGGEGLTISGNGDDSIDLLGSSKNRLSGLVVTGSTGADGFDLSGGSNKNKLFGNTVSGNDGDGIEIQDSVKNRVQGNTVQNNGEEGVILGGDKNRVEKNEITGNTGDGIELFSSKNRIQKNQITGNGDDGIDLEDAAKENRIQRNVVQGNSDGGAVIEATATRNLFKRNVFGVGEVEGEGNGGDGVFVESDAGARNKFVKNTANGNGNDGFNVGVASTTLIKNVANNNADDGIDAVPGTRGSGNSATGNGDVQCTPDSLC